jgi:hypothetical protein
MGSGIDDFLREDGIFEDSQALAIKEVVAYRLEVNAPSPRPGKPVTFPLVRLGTGKSIDSTGLDLDDLLT